MSKLNIYKALFKAQQEFPKVVKDAVNPHFRSKYADLETILETVNPVLWNNGLFFTHLSGKDTLGDYVASFLIHAETGEFLDTRFYPKYQREDVQGQGSGITYAQRYNILPLLGLAASADDDGNGASGKHTNEEIDKRQAEREKTASAYKPQVDSKPKTSLLPNSGLVVHMKFKGYEGKAVSELTDNQLNWLSENWNPGGNPKYPKTEKDALLQEAIKEELDKRKEREDIPF